MTQAERVQLIRKLKPKILQRAQAFGLPKEEAEDLAQELFQSKLIMSTDLIAPPEHANPDAHMNRVIRNFIKEWLRRKKALKRGGDVVFISVGEKSEREPGLVNPKDKEQTPEEEILNRELSSYLLMAINILNVRRKLAVILEYPDIFNLDDYTELIREESPLSELELAGALQELRNNPMGRGVKSRIIFGADTPSFRDNFRKRYQRGLNDMKSQLPDGLSLG